MPDEDENLKTHFNRLLLDELKAIGGRQGEMNENLNGLVLEFQLHKQDSQNRWDMIARLDAEQNELLAQHASRSDALQKQNELIEQTLRAEIFGEGIADPEKKKNVIVSRIEALELPAKSWGWVKQALLELGKIAAGAAAIYGFIKVFFPKL